MKLETLPVACGTAPPHKLDLDGVRCHLGTAECLLWYQAGLLRQCSRGGSRYELRSSIPPQPGVVSPPPRQSSMSPRLICGHLQAATTADGTAAGTTCAITLAQHSNPQLLELCRPGRRLRLVLAGDEHTALKLQGGGWGVVRVHGKGRDGIGPHCPPTRV